MNNYPPAILALADGTIFRGQSFGAPVTIIGEIVFNTSMTGYQEILTDPSYYGQIVTMTCPHIGNVGVNTTVASKGCATKPNLSSASNTTRRSRQGRMMRWDFLVSLWN
jgi:carbamoylphosphate synthase small subunit